MAGGCDFFQRFKWWTVANRNAGVRANGVRLMVHRYNLPGRNIRRVRFFYASCEFLVPVPLDGQPLPEGLPMADFKPPPGMKHLANWLAALPQNTPAII